MTPELITTTLQNIKSSIGTPYPTKTSAPIEDTIFNNFTNFLRNGPSRKIFLFGHSSGDYEYDEEMTTDREIDMELENNKLFNEIIEATEKILGKPAGEYPDDNSRISRTDYEDTAKEGEEYDGTEWTPEYEGGAVFENGDSYETRYWETSDEYVFLQKGKWTGDGNFLLFVLMTITRKIK